MPLGVPGRRNEPLHVIPMALALVAAAIGGGAYQINTLIQLYFLNQLDSGAVSYMNYADRLNQLPLGIIGIALGTAILPTLSRFVGGDNREGADRVQSDAIELAMLLTLPATVALAVCGIPFVTMIFQGGRFDPADAVVTGQVLTALVTGLPAYVLVKVLVPGFYARADTRTPVYAAVAALVVFVLLNLALLERFGVVGVAAASAVGAWLNGPIESLARDVLSPDSLRQSGVFQPSYVTRLLDEHRARRADHRKPLWTLLIFQLWYDRWIG